MKCPNNVGLFYGVRPATSAPGIVAKAVVVRCGFDSKRMQRS